MKSKSQAVIWSQSSHFVVFLIIHLIKNFSHTSYSVWHAIQEYRIRIESLAVILSQGSHFVTF